MYHDWSIYLHSFPMIEWTGYQETRENSKVFQEFGYPRVLVPVGVHVCFCWNFVILYSCYWEGYIALYILHNCCWCRCSFYFSLLVIWLHPSVWKTSENSKRTRKGTLLLDLLTTYLKLLPAKETSFFMSENHNLLHCLWLILCTYLSCVPSESWTDFLHI